MIVTREKKCDVTVVEPKRSLNIQHDSMSVLCVCNVPTLEECNLPALEVCNLPALEVCNLLALEECNVPTLEVCD